MATQNNFTIYLACMNFEFRPLVCFDVEWRSCDMFVSPLYEYNVLSSFPNDIVDGISFASFVLDDHLLTRCFGSINTYVQNIVSSLTAVYWETVISICFCVFYSEPWAFDLRCVGVSKVWNCRWSSAVVIQGWT